MGFWGEKTFVSVASSSYNMAGDERNRANFLRTTVVGKILARPNAQSMGDHIVTTYLNGPGMKLRGFARWSRLNGFSNAIGLDPARLAVSATDDLDIDVIATQIPLNPGETAKMQTATLGTADFTFWVDQFVAKNYPQFVGVGYESDFNEATNTITITFPDDSTASFNPVGFDSNASYIYAVYNVIKPENLKPLKPGVAEELEPTDPWPDTTGWTGESIETPASMVLNTTVHTLVEYSDSTPSTETTVITPRTENYEEIEAEWTKEQYKGRHPTQPGVLYNLISRMYWTQVGEVKETVDVDVTTEVVGAVTITTTVTTTTETLELVRTVKIDTQERWLNETSTAQIFIYKYGSGKPALDAMFRSTESFGAMFPFFPIRLENQFLSETFLPHYYGWTRRAYRRVMRQNINKVIETISDNPSLKDIDHAYVVFGVGLNTKESASIRYIYTLFKEILDGQTIGGAGGLSAWQQEHQRAAESLVAFSEWSNAQADELNPLFGTPPPAVIPYPPSPTYALLLTGAPDLQFKLQMSWSGMEESFGSGVLKPDAKRGDLWITKGGVNDIPQYIYNQDGELILGQPVSHDGITIYWQVDDDNWRKIDVYGLIHRNFVYGGKTVDITAHQALDDPDDTGFIVPLHEAIFRSMPIVPGTQTSTACMHMVFNSYTKRKQKWYETNAFKIFMVVVVIVITIASAGAAGPAGAGILGLNAAVGASLGFAGVAAVIVGAVANAVAAMLITQIISYVSTAVFGPEIGAIIGVIASIVALQVGTAYATGASLVGSLSSLMQPENLMRLTAAATDGASAFLRSQTQQTLQRTQAMLNEMQDKFREVQDKTAELLGGPSFFDPMTLTDVGYSPSFESSQTFLTRTLLTGTDIVNMSHDMMTNFVDLSMTTSTPGLS